MAGLKSGLSYRSRYASTVHHDDVGKSGVFGDFRRH